MIGFLSGQPQITTDKLIIQTAGGVGYLVFASSELLAQISHQEKVNLYIYSHIKEDRFELYGFANYSDQSMFELLITVSGLGPKTALGLMNYGSTAIIQAVQNAELSFFTSVPRVGKKLGQKIIIELKTKLGGLKDLDLSPKSQNYQDVKESLLALGFAENNIDQILPALENIEDQSPSISIKQAIKLL